MAKRGRPVEKYKFRNFEKTYRIYKREYYRAARKKWNRLNGRKSNARIPSSVSKEELRTVMADHNLLGRADFRADYKEAKKRLIEADSSMSPVKAIVSLQTYDISRKQYQGFREAVKSREFQELAANNKKLKDANLEKVGEFEFRSGKWADSDAFFKAADAYYWAMKEEALKKGYKDEKSQWRYAKQRVSEMFFNRDKDQELYWGDS